MLIKGKGTVQCSLTTHGRKNSIWAFFLNNRCNSLPSNWLNVSCIRHGWVGHDGRWIRVDQNNAVTFFTKGFTCLSTGVVKLTCLADDNRTSTNNQDAFNVSTFSHDASLITS